MQISKAVLLLTLATLTLSHLNQTSNFGSFNGRRRSSHSAGHFGMNPYGQGYHPQAYHAGFEQRGNHWESNGWNLNNYYGSANRGGSVGLDGLNMNLTTDRYYSGKRIERNKFNKPSSYYYRDLTSNPFVYTGYTHHNRQP